MEKPLGFENSWSNDVGKLEAQDPMEEENLAEEGEVLRPTFLSALLEPSMNEAIIKILKEYKDCFAWDYTQMPALDRSLVEHRLPLKLGNKPVKQTPQRFAPEVIQKIKAEI